MNCTGHSRGIAVLWRSKDEVVVTKFANNFIDVEVSIEGVASWRLTGFTTFPREVKESNLRTCFSNLRVCRISLDVALRISMTCSILVIKKVKLAIQIDASKGSGKRW